jgi:hypothetical protein
MRESFPFPKTEAPAVFRRAPRGSVVRIAHYAKLTEPPGRGTNIREMRNATTPETTASGQFHNPQKNR